MLLFLLPLLPPSQALLDFGGGGPLSLDSAQSLATLPSKEVFVLFADNGGGRGSWGKDVGLLNSKGDIIDQKGLFSEGFSGAGRSLGFNEELDNSECANRLNEQMSMMDSFFQQMETAQIGLKALGVDVGASQLTQKINELKDQLTNCDKKTQKRGILNQRRWEIKSMLSTGDNFRSKLAKEAKITCRRAFNTEKRQCKLLQAGACKAMEAGDGGGQNLQESFADMKALAEEAQAIDGAEKSCGATEDLVGGKDAGSVLSSRGNDAKNAAILGEALGALSG